MRADILDFSDCVSLGQKFSTFVSQDIIRMRLDVGKLRNGLGTNENLSQFYTDISQMLLEWYQIQDEENKQ